MMMKIIKYFLAWLFKKDSDHINASRLIVVLPILSVSYFGHILYTLIAQRDDMIILFRNYYNNLDIIKDGYRDAFLQDLSNFRGFTLVNSLIIFINLIIVLILYIKYRKQSIRVLLISNIIMAVCIGFKFIRLDPSSTNIPLSTFTPYLILICMIIYAVSIIYFIYKEDKELRALDQ